MPYEQYFKDLISEVKSVTFTALGLKNGGIVDIGKHITDKKSIKATSPRVPNVQFGRRDRFFSQAVSNGI